MILAAGNKKSTLSLAMTLQLGRLKYTVHSLLWFHEDLYSLETSGSQWSYSS